MPRIIDYLQSAVSDNTAHSQMDRLLLENEMDKDLIHRNAFTTMNRPFIESVPVDTSESGIEEYNKEILQENNPLRMNPAMQDETAHSQMDRLLLENEMNKNKPMQFSGEVTPENLQTYTTKRLQSMENPSARGRNLLIEVYDLIKPQLHRNALMESLGQQPQHSMGVAPEPYDPAKEFVEGMMPVGGALKLLKGSKHWPSFQKNLSKVAAHEKKVHEVLQQTSQTPLGKLMDKGGSDKATKDYLTTLWIQRNLK